MGASREGGATCPRHMSNWMMRPSICPSSWRRSGGGGEVVITKDEQPVARLVGYRQQTGKRQLGTARGLITIAEDFDEPLEDFAEHTR